jgi:hypothetical protein
LIKWLSWEDARICDNGHRIKHGNPSALIPLTWCWMTTQNLDTKSDETKKHFTIHTDFVDWTTVPSVYTCQGKDQSPAITFEDYWAGVKTFALTLQDPDAPSGVWDHWVMWNIPVGQDLTQNIVPKWAVVGKNSWWSLWYRWPCPPSGSHRYILTVYALDTELSLSAGSSASALQNAVKWHIVDSVVLTWTYAKHK